MRMTEREGKGIRYCYDSVRSTRRSDGLVGLGILDR